MKYEPPERKNAADTTDALDLFSAEQVEDMRADGDDPDLRDVIHPDDFATEPQLPWVDLGVPMPTPESLEWRRRLLRVVLVGALLAVALFAVPILQRMLMSSAVEYSEPSTLAALDGATPVLPPLPEPPPPAAVDDLSEPVIHRPVSELPIQTTRDAPSIQSPRTEPPVQNPRTEPPVQTPRTGSAIQNPRIDASSQSARIKPPPQGLGGPAATKSPRIENEPPLAGWRAGFATGSPSAPDPQAPSTANVTQVSPNANRVQISPDVNRVRISPDVNRVVTVPSRGTAATAPAATPSDRPAPTPDRPAPPPDRAVPPPEPAAPPARANAAPEGVAARPIVPPPPPPPARANAVPESAAAPTVPPPRAAASTPTAAPRSNANVPVSPTRELEGRGINGALARYRSAFSALDAGAAAQVWPTVDKRSLTRAFERLRQQEVSFDDCQIDIKEERRAEAVCSGVARYVPRVGSSTPQVDRRQWRFSLVKVRDEWLIGAVEAR